MLKPNDGDDSRFPEAVINWFLIGVVIILIFKCFH